ncbi:hypothetical protein [Pseudomonas psychrophila]|uniref:Uncharacterized protein n=1 Tax=Pseudomonas psychrophila TaxID=122355 RepID=A0A8I1FU85_9PSED|nr:hypothetical protein [Pseudomonas psychrophila]AVX93372.1 hypothetical protein PkP19E3_35370 [Pseudomonas koreensis]MBJ2258848.1 hypothetical protein [Pseudomonas psychrophila]
MTLTIDIVARITVVVLVIIFSIAFKRRKALFTVKNTKGDAQAALLENYVTREIRDTNLQLWLCGGFGSFVVAYCIYSVLAAG